MPICVPTQARLGGAGGISASRLLVQPFVGPLDGHKTGLTATCSIGRRLLSSYTGPIIRVRNSSGTELNIGYLENGSLDLPALMSHVGSGDGFVTTSFDQVSGNDFVQSIGGTQPKIVSAGSLVNVNGKPCVGVVFGWTMFASPIHTPAFDFIMTGRNEVDGAGSFAPLFLISSTNVINAFYDGGFTQGWTVFDSAFGQHVFTQHQNVWDAAELGIDSSQNARAAWGSEVFNYTGEGPDTGQVTVGSGGITADFAELAVYSDKLSDAEADAVKTILKGYLLP